MHLATPDSLHAKSIRHPAILLYWAALSKRLGTGKASWVSHCVIVAMSVKMPGSAIHAHSGGIGHGFSFIVKLPLSQTGEDSIDATYRG